MVNAPTHFRPETNGEVTHNGETKSSVRVGAETSVENGTDGINGKHEADGEGDKPGNLPPPEVAATIPCRFFPLGTCKYGEGCAFSHQVPPGGFTPIATAVASQPSVASPAFTSPSPVNVEQPQPQGHQPQPTTTLPSSTAAADFNGGSFPMAPVAQPPYFYYGMPQQFYPPMPFQGYVDANGYPMPMLGQPFVDFANQAGLTSPTTGGSSPNGMLPEGLDSPRLVESHPTLAEQMMALSVAQSQAAAAAAALGSPNGATGLPPFPMSPTMLPSPAMASPMSPQSPYGAHERRMSNSAFYASNGAPSMQQQSRGSMARASTSQVSRRSSTVGADPTVRTASAIISFPASPNGVTSPASPSARSFGSHSRFSTEPGLRQSTNGSPTKSHHAGGPSHYPCAFFPENRCKNGDHCRYTHLLPSGEDARQLNQGMIGVDGRTNGPAEPSKNFIFPSRGTSRGGMRGGGSSRGLGRSYGSRASFGAYGMEEMQGGVMTDGIESSRRYVDDEARERVERFIESTRGPSGATGRSASASPTVTTNGMGQKVPSVGDFPALANDSNSTPLSPKSPKLNGDNGHAAVTTPDANESETPSSPPSSATKFAGSFASAAARGAKAAAKTSTSPAVVDATPLPAVAVGASS